MAEGYNPDEIRVLSWNIMGETLAGWAEARSEIVQHNIQGYDIVFLQEVQWREKNTKKKLATPAGYKVGAMTRSKYNNRNISILYKSAKLRCEGEETEEDDSTDDDSEDDSKEEDDSDEDDSEEDDSEKEGDLEEHLEEEEEEDEEKEEEDTLTSKVTTTLKSLKGWTEEYSKRLCVQVFTLAGEEDTSKFVAISLHAPNPKKEEATNERFCRLVKASIKRVVAVYKLPVLVGGDFNSDIRCWKDSGFLGLDDVYKAGHGHKPIDFITMKVPRKENHLEMAKVRKMECDKIAIPGYAKTIKVKMTVKNCISKKSNIFYKHLCGNHMPLTVVVKYSPNAIQSEGSENENKSWEELEAEIVKSDGKIKERKEKIKKMEEEIASLKEKIVESKAQQKGQTKMPK